MSVVLMASHRVLVVSILICATFSKTLPCDGVEYDTTSGYRIMEAAGVCLPITNSANQYYGGSFMKICDPTDTNTILESIWTTTNCSGDPTTTHTWIGLDTYKNITITCCSGNQCEYALKKEHKTYVCPDDNPGSSAYVIGTCSAMPNDNNVLQPAFYKSCTDGKLLYTYWASDSFNCNNVTNSLGNATLVNGEDDYCFERTITCHTANDTCLIIPSIIMGYLGWIAFIALVIIYGIYKGFIYLRSRCNKQKKVSDPELKVNLIVNDGNNHKQQNEPANEKNQSNDELMDAFKPSLFSSFTDVQDIINSTIFVLYFDYNTGYELDSLVGDVQIFLFSVEIIFQIIDIFVCIVWNFNLNKCVNIDRKLIVNYYKFKIIQINFSFVKVIFKLYYSFDQLHQNITFYNIVFGLTMVFKSYWMLIIDVIAKKNKGQENVSGIKTKIINKAQDVIIQLIIITPLFFVVNSIILALEVMNNRIIMLIYCALWFIGPWIYFISIKVSKYIKRFDCEKCMSLLCGISQMFINALMFIIGIVGGIFVSIPKLQFYLTGIIYGIVGIGVCLTCFCQYIKGNKLPYKTMMKCCCFIYMLPFIIAVGFYAVESINEDTESDTYDEENTDHENYDPIDVVP